MKFDWIVLGAGFTGLTFAERAARSGKRVLVIDERDHIGGNSHDEFDPGSGVLIHPYGPHIFHTNSTDVWNYLSQFTEWRPYFHEVQGLVDGQLVPIPFNLNSLSQLFPRIVADSVTRKLLENYRYGDRIPILELRKSSDPEIKMIADFVYEKVFLIYTKKQWNLSPEELSPSVTARIPFVLSRDNRYFSDRYQAMPKDGYSAMFRRMVAGKNISLLLNTKWEDCQGAFPHDQLLFTGCIDAYFNYSKGHLPYRSLQFTRSVVNNKPGKSVAVTNYPENLDITRITDITKLTGQESDKSILISELPNHHTPGKTTPYYPIPTDGNKAIFSQYQDLAAALEPKVIFAGRLGDYQYYNMDQAVARALMLQRKWGA